MLKERICELVKVSLLFVDETVLAICTLDLADVYTVVGHYLHHRAEVEDYLNQRQGQAQKVRLENEERFSPVEIRERLLARQHQQHV